MTQIEVEPKQQLRDIAMKYYGSLVGIFWLCQDNNIPGHYLPLSGEKLKIREEYINKQMALFFSTNDYKPSSLK